MCIQQCGPYGVNAAAVQMGKERRKDFLAIQLLSEGIVKQGTG